MSDSLSKISKWVIEGSSSPKIVVAGHSHILAMLGALHVGSEDNFSSAGVYYSHDRNLWPNMPPEYWDEISREIMIDTVAICWNGNQHNALFLLETEPPITVYNGIESDINSFDGRQVVPIAMFDELWKEDFQRLEVILLKVRSKKKVVLLGTPPPKSRVLIRSNLGSDEYFVNQLAAHGLSPEEAPITSDIFRFTLWKKIQGALLRIAKEHGVPFVAAPPSVFDNNLMLRDEFSAPDASHANHKYGKVMWEELILKCEVN